LESFVYLDASFVPAARLRALALAALGGLAVAACGRIGSLEPPPDPNAPPKPAQSSTESGLNPQVKPSILPITPPKQPFILDPLLK
jgi:predicted small lipoprotein YifL